MMISGWSILNGVVLGTFLIVLFHFCLVKKAPKKNALKPYFLMLMLIILRVMVPIDHDKMLVIHSIRILTRLYEIGEIAVFENVTIWMILCLTWGIGVVFSLLIWIVELRKEAKTIHELIQRARSLPDEYVYIAEKVGVETKSVFLSKDVSEAITVGVTTYNIIIPDIDYSKNDLENILSHELAHILNKDIVIKLALHTVACIMWWNPVMKLFERDYAILMEYRCDDCTVKYSTDLEKISYVETLKKMAVNRSEFNYGVGKAGFATESDKSILVSRAKRIFEKEKTNKKRLICIVAAEIIAFICSYITLPQPYYDPDDPVNCYVEGEIHVDASNSYMVSVDGGYMLYVDGEEFGIVLEKELCDEPYCHLQIR